jgi:hypothetical protein
MKALTRTALQQLVKRINYLRWRWNRRRPSEGPAGAIWLTKKRVDPLQLNLGCGGVNLPDYVNVDADPDSAADVLLDFRRIGDLYAKGSVARVQMIHSLAYLRLWQARDLLRALCDLLQAGGMLVIETPDLTKCARVVLESAGDPARHLEGVRAIYAFDVAQDRRRDPYATYAFGWAAWHLERELREAGFREVRVLDPLTHGSRTWRDTRFEAVK